ncbi:FAD-dependent oxidoreductase [Clostridium thermosuccinogenes]|uniref:FAD-dependent oxidoreductase n=1 Tax=Clostridium thermosuccinogenes TaxID=84032 RepID=UPI000CCC9712|nr:FAD-dependent oxidoreductase [Pseudoclostridium thermosuccinogenes]PNT91566.1 FAD-dependent oxidoreductase [Pseudoclostridium thermosuccinogenes]
MNIYTLKEKKIQLDDSWDVIVIGGGPAGCTAAAAAAREGSRTLLIEATGCLGGMGTSGLVPVFCPFSDKEKIIYRGLAEKVLNEMKKGMAHVDDKKLDWVPIDCELLKRIYDDMVVGSGAQVLFNTFLSAVDTDGQGNVTAIIVSNKAGLTAYKAKVYIDCTGDADLCAWAGASFQKGDEKTGDLQPATLCFTLSNVDENGFLYGVYLHSNNPDSPIYDIVKSGKYPLITDVHINCHQVGPSTIGFNAGHLWNVDNTDPLSVSRALIQGRKMAASYRDALAEYHPKAFSNSYLSNTAALMGIRETRRIIGDYLLTVDDYLARRRFSDEISVNSYYIDVHSTKNEAELSNAGKIDLKKREHRYGKGEFHGIPYRCLTPKELRNVLVAGRSISCDRMVQGSIRVMPSCLAMGEAAGLAGALAARNDNVNVHEVDVDVLRQRLREEGAFLPD